MGRTVRPSNVLLALAWYVNLTPKYQRTTAHYIAGMGESFARTIQAATGRPVGPPSQSVRIARIVDAYLADRITAVSLDIQLTHIPGGLPPIEETP